MVVTFFTGSSSSAFYKCNHASPVYSVN